MQTIIPFIIKRKGFSDPTGAFPHKSSIEKLYVMFMYDYDRNVILFEQIKSRQAATIHDKFLNIHKIVKARGSDPKFYIMYNKCSIDLKEAMKKYEIYFQLYPTHMNRKNVAERAIITYKNHFISGFSTIDPDFPIR